MTSSHPPSPSHHLPPTTPPLHLPLNALSYSLGSYKSLHFLAIENFEKKKGVLFCFVSWILSSGARVEWRASGLGLSLEWSWHMWFELLDTLVCGHVLLYPNSFIKKIFLFMQQGLERCDPENVRLFFLLHWYKPVAIISSSGRESLLVNNNV